MPASISAISRNSYGERYPSQLRREACDDQIALSEGPGDKFNQYSSSAGNAQSTLFSAVADNEGFCALTTGSTCDRYAKDTGDREIHNVMRQFKPGNNGINSLAIIEADRVVDHGLHRHGTFKAGHDIIEKNTSVTVPVIDGIQGWMRKSIIGGSMLRGPSGRISFGLPGRMLPQSSMNRMQLRFLNIVQVRK